MVIDDCQFFFFSPTGAGKNSSFPSNGTIRGDNFSRCMIVMRDADHGRQLHQTARKGRRMSAKRLVNRLSYVVTISSTNFAKTTKSTQSSHIK
jgi:hypothetical protein